MDGVFFRSFRRPSFIHFHPSNAPYAFPSIKKYLVRATIKVFYRVFSAKFAFVNWFSIFNYSRTGVTALNVFRLHISLVSIRQIKRRNLPRFTRRLMLGPHWIRCTTKGVHTASQTKATAIYVLSELRFSCPHRKDLRSRRE